MLLLKNCVWMGTSLKMKKWMNQKKKTNEKYQNKQKKTNQTKGSQSKKIKKLKKKEHLS